MQVLFSILIYFITCIDKLIFKLYNINVPNTMELNAIFKILFGKPYEINLLKGETQ